MVNCTNERTQLGVMAHPGKASFASNCQTKVPNLAELCNDAEDGNVDVGTGQHRVACYALTGTEVHSGG